MVAKVALNMRQDRNEAISAFGARLAGQAAICKVSVQCPHELCCHHINYTDAKLKDALIGSTADSDIQLDLNDKNQEMSLEDILQFVEAKEAGK
ncbi:hypothetical protein ElyMa_003543500 [Elysia marginata]|uniref:Uncharacterized protein n=1 Tax=Elysia marginata TaxID=1093978 RepID=A0AAV4EIU7_9GAST|nr:hypothetical protein ElyMa_003543500 [Elysia marginata]